MKKNLRFLLAGICVLMLGMTTMASAAENTSGTLTNRQRLLVPIAGNTAKGDMDQLTKALNEGLDHGMTINEGKEVLLQMYAYCGFPRALNALNNFRIVVETRQANGINDPVGEEPQALPTNETSVEFGTRIQTELVGQPIGGAPVYKFQPAIDQFLKGHLFGDIFARGLLDYKTREIATVSALAGMGHAENQLRSHMGVAIYNGVTDREMNEIIQLLTAKVGKAEGEDAKSVFAELVKNRK